ncbi:hypothetical protein [Streptacidiphilus sp. EB129]|uniref:hypothetical protein n=1 Tax=Streptacidiphilus sp. EB129 TaxID=3156262 RepID=UPI0035184DE6
MATPTKTKKPAATAANRNWNHKDGSTPPPARRKTTALVEMCPDPACGLEADQLDSSSDPTLWGWIRTEVVGSKEPARLWDSAQCAARGIALAQLRMEAEQ